MSGPLDGLAALGAERVGALVVSRDGIVASSGSIEEILPIASVTKLLIAYCFLVALEERSITLEDRCGPEGATVAHLLAHASGISYSDPNWDLARPGERRIYSNAGFELLGAHLETRTGISPGAYLTEAVLEPLAMSATSLEGSPAYGARSSAHDLARLAGELLVPRLVAPSTLAAARAVAFPSLSGVLPGFGYHDPCDWGLGMERRGEKAPHWTGTTNSPATFGHFGQSGAFVWVDPEAELALALVSDLSFGEAARRWWPSIADEVLASFA